LEEGSVLQKLCWDCGWQKLISWIGLFLRIKILYAFKDSSGGCGLSLFNTNVRFGKIFTCLAQFNFFGRVFLSVFLPTLGVGLGALAIYQFRKAKTTINPVKLEDTMKLVTSGVYNYTRNPMYLALLLGLLGWGLHLQNAFNVLLAAGFVSYMNRFQIFPEEQMMRDKFGKDYNFYCKLTRRWF
jgi:protein-S-isoprenylcysteine O-methyltransferase Ste14